MSELLISPEELHRAAQEFSLGSKESQAIVKRLETATAELENKWAGAAQQVFFKNYKEWRQHMGGFVALLNGISQELHAMAERFEQADR